MKTPTTTTTERETLSRANNGHSTIFVGDYGAAKVLKLHEITSVGGAHPRVPTARAAAKEAPVPCVRE